ncbi:leucine-rich repeat-containing protein 74A-like [Mytilus californianus]|uniref:leucine-rich repeat-containing protein 74A-like n=1 Tax=Mytilus californianus TaxID=6549 RepID=UPI0022472673|nr:leucine-rich repeat-containing protein 74A-like [Mytilus californianus]
MRKKRRTFKKSIDDLSNEISRCLIKRPSLILNDEILDFNRNIYQSIQLNTTSSDEFELSDFEDDEDTNESVYTCQEQYLRSCEKYHVVPVSRFYRQLEGNSVILKNHQFNKGEFKACAVALMCNGTVTQLDIEGGQIGAVGMSHLSDLIYHTDLLVELNLTKNDIGRKGLILLEEAMDKNLKLKELNLSDNNINGDDCDIIRQIMEGDNMLQSLNLSHNIICNIGGQHIARGLVKNDGLKSLNLSWNRITGNGAAAIGYALAKNSDLEVLNVSWNGFEHGGAHALAHGLSQNTCLKELDVCSNRIGQSGVAKLMKGVNENTTLEALTIADNSIRTSDTFMVLLTIEKHEQLSYLDFGNQPVTDEFEQKVSEIGKEKKLVVKYGKIIRNPNPRKKDGDDRMYISGDPLLVLLEFTRMKKIHILDMFRAFDTDGSHSISWEEFGQGIEHNKLPIRPSDIDKIIQSIDINMDGQVDFSELVIAHKEHTKKFEKFTARGEDVFQRSEIGIINERLRKWFADSLLTEAVS